MLRFLLAITLIVICLISFSEAQWGMGGMPYGMGGMGGMGYGGMGYGGMGYGGGYRRQMMMGGMMNPMMGMMYGKK